MPLALSRYLFGNVYSRLPLSYSNPMQIYLQPLFFQGCAAFSGQDNTI